MLRRPVLIAIAVILLQPAAGAAAFAGERTIAVFASERILGRWVGSWFAALPKPDAAPNECESVLVEALAGAGFAFPTGPYSEPQQLEAKRLHAVFARYGDLSGMPNETVLRAGRAVAADPQAVVACGVSATPRRMKGEVCASAGCKAVDAATKRRVATAAGARCVAGSDRTTASVAAIRDACRDAGALLGPALAERYGASL